TTGAGFGATGVITGVGVSTTTGMTEAGAGETGCATSGARSGAGSGSTVTGACAASACADTERASGNRVLRMLMAANLRFAPGENKTGPRNFRPVFLNIGSVLFCGLEAKV